MVHEKMDMELQMRTTRVQLFPSYIEGQSGPQFGGFCPVAWLEPIQRGQGQHRHPLSRPSGKNRSPTLRRKPPRMPCYPDPISAFKTSKSDIRPEHNNSVNVMCYWPLEHCALESIAKARRERSARLRLAARF